ncbi:hypothetical protein [Candidatus Nitrosoglobus terrae]|uniref:hypothetical protein n=1 Tax=Candidatus Nitrosoglobus terrae TaxID=1630141 RepID=UPI0018D567E6|nr:hypothetical protein [Candidatus Nitrosoglobus terrae]
MKRFQIIVLNIFFGLGFVSAYGLTVDIQSVVLTAKAAENCCEAQNRAQKARNRAEKAEEKAQSKAQKAQEKVQDKAQEAQEKIKQAQKKAQEKIEKIQEEAKKSQKKQKEAQKKIQKLQTETEKKVRKIQEKAEKRIQKPQKEAQKAQEKAQETREMTQKTQEEAQKIDAVFTHCVIIAGDYPGFRVIASGAGGPPQICLDRSREKVDAVKFWNVAFVATEAFSEARTVSFEHDFRNGPRGLVYGGVRLKGFFATPTGVGVPSGSKVWFTGLFSQTGHDEIIGEELSHEVGEVLDSALLSKDTQSQFILSGPRILKGVLKFLLLNKGDKLVLESGTTVSIDVFDQH